MVIDAPGPLRDPRADREHFDRVIERLADDAERYRAQVEWPADHRRRRGNPALDVSSWVGVHLADARRFSASYSRGDERDRLLGLWDSWLDASVLAAREKKRPAAEAQRAAQDTPKVSADLYASRLWLVSTGLALGVDDDAFARVCEAVEPLLDDRLISLLVAARRPDVPVADEVWFDRRFGRLAAAITGPADDRSAGLARHLSGWYPRMRGTSWWDGHRYGGKGHYIGYWSFETAGAVAAWGIDDSAFRDHEYYPGDLLDRRR